MRRAFPLFLAFFFSLTCLAFASTAPQYSFGTMYDAEEVNVTAGGQARLAAYFFSDSEYGNKPYYVTLHTASVPEGWTIEFIPSLREIEVEFEDGFELGTGNVYVVPKQVLPEIPDPPEEGVFYLASPSGLGYLQSQRVELLVGIPETASSGSYIVTIGASAEYLGQGGMLSVAQTRDLDYEIIVTQSEAAPSPPPSTPPTVQDEPAAQGDSELLLPAVAAILIVLFLAIILYFKFKGKK